MRNKYIQSVLSNYEQNDPKLRFVDNSLTVVPRWQLVATRWKPAAIHVSHYDDVIMTTLASQITSLMVVYSTIYSDADQRKHQSSSSLAFVWGIHRDRWIPRTKGQLRGNVSIWWRHHGVAPQNALTWLRIWSNYLTTTTGRCQFRKKSAVHIIRRDLILIYSWININYIQFLKQTV